MVPYQGPPQVLKEFSIGFLVIDFSLIQKKKNEKLAEMANSCQLLPPIATSCTTHSHSL